MILPAQFADRWGGHRDRLSYDDALCWHLLLGGHPEARTMASDAQQRLARFDGLHMTPLRWLHVTVLRIGTTGQLTGDGLNRALARAQAALAETPPVKVSLGKLFYHPEAIAVGVSPPGALTPILAAARAALPEGLGGDGYPDEWTPHATLCYSTSEQSAAPVIAELGGALPAREVTIDAMSLVMQDGPERLWNWRVVGTVRLLGTTPTTVSHDDLS